MFQVVEDDEGWEGEFIPVTEEEAGEEENEEGVVGREGGMRDRGFRTSEPKLVTTQGVIAIPVPNETEAEQEDEELLDQITMALFSPDTIPVTIGGPFLPPSFAWSSLPLSPSTPSLPTPSPSPPSLHPPSLPGVLSLLLVSSLGGLVCLYCRGRHR